jgi:hypothetical protein
VNPSHQYVRYRAMAESRTLAHLPRRRRLHRSSPGSSNSHYFRHPPGLQNGQNLEILSIPRLFKMDNDYPDLSIPGFGCNTLITRNCALLSGFLPFWARFQELNWE